MSWLDRPHGQDAHAPCYRARYVGGPYDGRTEITAHPHPERVLLPAATTLHDGHRLVLAHHYVATWRHGELLFVWEPAGRPLRSTSAACIAWLVEEAP